MGEPHEFDAADEAELQRLAERLNCLTERQLAALGDYTTGSVESLRRRGELPPHIRFGRNFFYPIDGVREFFKQRLKAKAVESVEDLL